MSTDLVIGMKGNNIIEEIKNLLENMGIETTRISGKSGTGSLGNGMYTFNIKTGFIKKYKELIDFMHPEKHKKLEVRIRIIERNLLERTRPLDWTRNEILRLISIKPMLTLDICEKLLLTIGGLYHHLRYLEKKRLIHGSGYKSKIIWRLGSSPDTFIKCTVPLIINNGK